MKTKVDMASGNREEIVEGNWAITGGTGGLSGLNGQGTFTWYFEDSVQIRRFDALIHFDPK